MRPKTQGIVPSRPAPILDQVKVEPSLPDLAIARAQDGDAIFGSVGKLDGDDRLIVPAEIRGVVTWLKGKKPIRLIAELREKGRVRFHPHDRISDSLAELRTRIKESHPRTTEALAVLADRYREVTYYPSDTRIHLSPPVVVYLGAEAPPRSLCYIETRETHLDVMVLSVRDERLKLWMNELELAQLGA